MGNENLLQGDGPVVSDGDDIPVCPTCGTDVWIRWNMREGSGKCQYKHMISTDPQTGELYNSAQSNE